MKVGEDPNRDCRTVYRGCKFSIFNFVPDIYTEKQKLNVTLDDLEMGNGFEDARKRFAGTGNKDDKNIFLDFDLTKF